GGAPRWAPRHVCARPLEDADLRRGLAPRSYRGPFVLDGPINGEALQWRSLPPLRHRRARADTLAFGAFRHQTKSRSETTTYPDSTSIRSPSSDAIILDGCQMTLTTFRPSSHSCSS